eukprot:5168871-Ditylum_brightwellii.AAC.1
MNYRQNSKSIEYHCKRAALGDTFLAHDEVDMTSQHQFMPVAICVEDKARTCCPQVAHIPEHGSP